LYPSDEFGRQELPTEQIPAFVKKSGLPVDGDGCTLMAKTEVNGADPVWNYCKMAFPGQVQWNFAAFFLVDKTGTVVGRFSARELDKCDAALAQLSA